MREKIIAAKRESGIAFESYGQFSDYLIVRETSRCNNALYFCRRVLDNQVFFDEINARLNESGFSIFGLPQGFVD